MKEILLSQGFRLKSVCSCGGTYQETWGKQTVKGYISFNIKPNKNIWNMTIDGVHNCKGNSTNLNDKINEVVQA